MTVKTRKAVKVISIVLCVVLVLCIGAVAFFKSGEAKLRQGLTLNDDMGITYDADVTYNGKNYNYNNNLINVLFISVDKENINTTAGKQVNSLFLLSVDTEKDVVNIIPIPCNTLTDIDEYDEEGKLVATRKDLIGLAYGYGVDEDNSANLSCRAVTRLLHNVPISAYCTIFTETLVDMVDTIGGVKVTIPEDMTNVDATWKKGATVTLSSKTALRFIRYDDTVNIKRSNRQRVFLEAFATNARAAMFKDLSLPLKILNKFNNGMVTSMNSRGISYLVSEVIAAQFVFNEIKGAISIENEKEVFTPDTTALYEKVLELFYQEQN